MSLIVMPNNQAIAIKWLVSAGSSVSTLSFALSSTQPLLFYE
jgi:hypothetical protein